MEVLLISPLVTGRPLMIKLPVGFPVQMAPAVRVYRSNKGPKWVIVMGACAPSGGMFNNHAIGSRGHPPRVPVGYLFVCPPRPEAPMDAILNPCEQIGTTKLGVNRAAVIRWRGRSCSVKQTNSSKSKGYKVRMTIDHGRFGAC
jgi:NADH:ubiquinone oxidoreductase subunit B-like Fe-S oxidoreductase